MRSFTFTLHLDSKYKCFISCLYRSPSQSDYELNVFLDDLEKTLSKLYHESPLCSVFLGDFNAKCNKLYPTDVNSFPGIELDNLFSQTGFTQLIKK